MKKTLKFFVMAFAALAFMGCPNGQQGSDLTSISFKEPMVKVLIGDTTRLVLLAEPATVALPEDLTITSSDTNVVVVLDNQINIVAVASGTANIIAKAGDLEAVCKIEASTYEESWALDWMYYFPDTEKEISPDTIDLEGLKCKLYSYEFFMPSTPDFAEDLSAGEGECVFATAIVPVIVEGEYKGEIASRQFEIVDSPEKLGMFTAMKGNIDPAVVGSIFQPYFEGLNAGEQLPIDWDTYEQAGVTGAVIRGAMITETGGISYYYQCDGIVTSGVFARVVNQEGTAYEFVYDFTAQWFGGFLGLGLATNWDAETYADVLIQPFATEYSCAYRYTVGQPAQPLALNAPAKVKKANRTGLMITREKPVRVKFFSGK